MAEKECEIDLLDAALKKKGAQLVYNKEKVPKQAENERREAESKGQSS